MSTIFSQASATAGVRTTALLLNARALTADLAIARSICAASTQEQNTAVYPQFEAISDRYRLYSIHLPRLPLNEVKQGYIEEVLKPNFSLQMRRVFDRRLQSLTIDPEEISDATELATHLPTMALSGLLTFSAADAFCDDFLEFLRERSAMGYEMLVKFQQEDTAFLHRLTDHHLALFPFFAAALSGIATHQVGSLLMVGGFAATVSLMLKLAKYGAAKSQAYMEKSLQELHQATVIARDVQGILIKRRPQILEIERRPVPPL